MVGFYRLLLLVIFIFPLTVYSQHSLYEKQNVIRIKFKEEVGNKLEAGSFTRTATNYIKTGVNAIDELNQQHGALHFKKVFAEGGKFAARRRKFGLHLWYEVTFDTSKGQSLENLLKEYAENIAVQEAEPLYAKQISTIPGVVAGPVKTQSLTGEGQSYIPNDPRLGEQWHYNNTGQTGGTPGADMKLFSAWDIQKGSSEVIVSIHDGGIDVNHSDIMDNLWINSAELNGTPGVDDDGNGYIDDVHGYNHADGTGNVTAEDHGTHVAGTVAAVNNNGIGVSGVAGGSGTGDGVRLMSCQVFGDINNGGFAESYAYAADNGSIISQNSWGYTMPGNYEQSVLDAIDYFIANAGYDADGNPIGPMQGGIVIFAAGNSNSTSAHYPGYYEPVLAVASTNHNDQKSWYSNYGSWVDMSAPGGETSSVSTEGVLSTLPNNSYGFYQGTSMACPHVSGVAALIVSQYGGAGLTPEQVRYRLVETTDDIDALNPSYSGSLGTGRMNAFAALLTDDGIAPDAITDLSASEMHHDKIVLTWTAPEDEDNVSAMAYEIRYSTSPITSANFASATLAGNTSAQSAGSSETFEVDGLASVTQYYFAIKSYDFFSNESLLSNVLTAATSNPPAISVTPLSLVSNLYTGESETRQIAITNTGEGFLEYFIEIGPTGYNPSRLVLAGSPVFVGLDKPKAKSEPLSGGKLYKQDQFVRASNVSQTSSTTDLQVVLDTLSFAHESISTLIPDQYLFLEGNTGNGIDDGGGDMYDGGNYLQTNLGGNISYTAGTISTSSYLGGEQYFTAKYPGLFVFAADMNGQSFFGISGNLGADGSGNVDGAVLQLNKGGKSYLGFVKRVYNAYDPSVNHLVIVEDNGSADHEFATDSNSDFHRVNNLDGVERIYYLLFAGANGAYINDNDMLAVMERFLDMTEIDAIEVEAATGTVASGQTALVDVTFDASNRQPGQYLNDLIISSNAETGDVIVNTELNITGAPNITSNPTEVDFGEALINATTQVPLYIKNTGTDELVISGVALNHAFYDVDLVLGPIPAGDSLLVDIYFTPTAVGASGADMVVTSNDPNNAQYTVSLSGTGVEAPIIGVTPPSLTENLYSGQTVTRALTVTNTGGSNLNYNTRVVYNAEPSSAPQIFELKPLSTQVQNPESGEHGYRKFDGYEAILSDLEDDSVGIFNYYNHSILAGDLKSRGAILGDLNFPLGNISGFNVIIIDDMISGASSSDLSLLKTYVENGGSLVIEADNSTSSTNITNLLSGTGLVFNSISYTTEVIDDIEAHPTTTGVSLINSTDYGAYYTNASTEIMRDGYGRVHVTESKLGAGRLFLIGNELMADFDIYSNDNRLFANQVVDWLIGGGGSWIDLVGSEGSITPQGSQQIEVTLDATDLVGGTYEANILLSSNDPALPEVEVPVTLNVTGTPRLELSTAYIDLGNVFIGQQVTDSVKFTNTGTETLEVTDISVSHSDYVISHSSLSLERNEAIWVFVTSTPSVQGAITANITITSNDLQSPTTTVALKTTGTHPPSAEVTPVEIHESLVSGQSVTRKVLIANEGDGEMSYTVYPQDENGWAGSEWIYIFNYGTINVSQYVEEQVVIDATNLGPGEYKGYVAVYSNDPAKQIIKVPVFLTVCASASSSAPKIKKPIGDRAIDPDDGKLLIDLEAVFESDKSLRYAVFASKSGLAHVRVDGAILSVIPVEEGVMEVTVQAFDQDCGKREEHFTLTIQQITSVNGEVSGASNIKVYPNPADETGATLEILTDKPDFVTIDIVDINGRVVQKVFSGNLKNGMNPIDISGNRMEKGVYLVRVAYKDYTDFVRLLIN